ncbi:unnamed protein product, partial [Meganyctiphanes norvegica]
TELGFSEKQQLAHGVLLRLLRVTSHLPMVEFSHAIDTCEMLTDAIKLGHRVHLSIRHDEEDDDISYDCGEYDDDDDDEIATGMDAATMEMENNVSSTTDLQSQQLDESRLDVQDESPEQTDTGSSSEHSANQRYMAEELPRGIVAEKRPSEQDEEEYYEDERQVNDVDVKG